MHLCLKILKAEIKNISVTSVVISELIKRNMHHICREFDTFFVMCTHCLATGFQKWTFILDLFIFTMCILDLSLEKTFEIYFYHLTNVPSNSF